jgi:hypothetical protein
VGLPRTARGLARARCQLAAAGSRRRVCGRLSRGILSEFALQPNSAQTNSRGSRSPGRQIDDLVLDHSPLPGPLFPLAFQPHVWWSTPSWTPPNVPPKGPCGPGCSIFVTFRKIVCYLNRIFGNGATLSAGCVPGPTLTIPPGYTGQGVGADRPSESLSTCLMSTGFFKRNCYVSVA